MSYKRWGNKARPGAPRSSRRKTTATYTTRMGVTRRSHRSSGTLAVLLAAILLGLTGCLIDSSPIVVLGSQAVTGPAPLDVSFDLSNCAHPFDRPMEYRLDFGDDSAPAVGTEFDLAIHHTYQIGGVYTAILVVNDDEGRQGIDTLTITTSEQGPPVGLEKGSLAPDFTAHTTDGGNVTLSDQLGNVVLLEFWGAWCPPCRTSMPHLDNLLWTYSDRGLVAIIVSTDPREQDAAAFLDDNGYDDFISVWEPGGKAANPIARLYGVSSSDVGIPRTFLLDRQGVIRYVGHPIDLTGPMIEAAL